MGHEDWQSFCLSMDVIVWECPTCDSLMRSHYKEDTSELYTCPFCGFAECDIREFINDIEYHD